ncbi:sodium channel protein Nach [Photinus pyralis]|nr:sodium channel protein Nach [Photinus pyralis]
MQTTIREYLRNSSFHGIRYLAEQDRHWTERLFWLTCCVVSWFSSAMLMRAAWYDFHNNAVSFVVETNYLDWDTHFPTVAVCETDAQDNIAVASDALFGSPHDYNLDEMIAELVFFRGLAHYVLQLCSDTPHPDCFRYNYSFYETLVRQPCSTLFRKCKWNQEEFDCCKYFSKIETELGTCYAINSLQAKEKKPRIKMISNRRTGPGTFHLQLSGITDVYLLSHQDVPCLTTPKSDVIQVAPHIRFKRSIVLEEIVNQLEVRDVSVEQRNCRFPEESDLATYKYYSYSACNVECRKDAQLAKCNCTHHYMPNTDISKQCDIRGLECLNQHYNDLAVLRAHWANRPGLVCPCIPSCTDMEMTVIRDDKVGTHHDWASVEIHLERLPSERFKRTVVRGKLDLVVSMGGSVGLFVGASLLSFVEVFYYFTLRAIKKSNHEEKPEEPVEVLPYVE